MVLLQIFSSEVSTEQFAADSEGNFYVHGIKQEKYNSEFYYVGGVWFHVSDIRTAFWISLTRTFS